MDWSALAYDCLAQILSIVIPAVILILGIIIINWLKKKGVKQEYIEIVQNAYNYLSDCVLYVNQTIVDYAKSHGQWDMKKQEEAKLECVNRFNVCLTEVTKTAIEQIYGDLNEWLETNIESLVNSAKLEK